MATDPMPQLVERLLNALQTMAPLIQRLAVTSRQQAADAALALNACEQAVAAIQAFNPKGGA